MPKRSGKSEKPRKDSRELILDGAETVFSEKGFYGSTTRDIAARSGVHLGLLGYYFPTKLDLYRAVITRRAEEYSGAMLASLHGVRGGGDWEDVPVGALIQALFRPIVDFSLNRGPGWKNYIRLLARAANTRRTEPYVQTFMETFNPVSLEFIDVLKQRFPNAAEEDIYWSQSFLAGAINHALIETEAVDRYSNGLCKSSDLETVLAKLGPFFAAGMIRLAQGES
ncbi:MAG: TetR/AcrR family transcriptional regulator [Gammaproteobacteria bacterium]|nr:TetR/AcrR family transcriptional regulator [Gammaproteobacteria bacterium]MDE0363939.1 TetR/AcrR family transcriptional regulator [Gammaproteobacteria bacterium]